MQNYSKLIKNLKSEEIDIEYERIRTQSKNRSYSTKNSKQEQTSTNENEIIKLKNQIYILQEQVNNEKQRSIQLENMIKKLKLSLIESDKELLQKCEKKMINIQEKDIELKQCQQQMNILQQENEDFRNNICEYQELELSINKLTIQYNQICPNLQEQQVILNECSQFAQSLIKLITPLLDGITPQLEDLFKAKLKSTNSKKYQLQELCSINLYHIKNIQQILKSILDQIDQKYISEIALNIR